MINLNIHDLSDEDYELALEWLNAPVGRGYEYFRRTKFLTLLNRCKQNEGLFRIVYNPNLSQYYTGTLMLTIQDPYSRHGCKRWIEVYENRKNVIEMCLLLFPEDYYAYKLGIK